jgi:predicted MFS family arabinose efflux permease
MRFGEPMVRPSDSVRSPGAGDAPAANRESGRQMTGAAAMWVVAIELAVVFMGSTLPTPLYPDYRRAFGFSEVTLTLIYAAYVIGNLAALFIFGRLSDQIGRRRVTSVALGLAAASTLLFAFAEGTAWLFAARILSGLAIGMAAGTATAWIAELHPEQDRASATTIATAFNLAGLGIGSLAAGLLSQYGPWPFRLAYVLYLALLAATGVVVRTARETIETPVQRLADLSLRPRLGIPKEIRAPFLSPAVTAFGIFALLGFYAALTPSLLRESLHQGSNAVSGAVVCEVFFVAAAVAVATKGLRSRTAMFSALGLLLPSLALLVMAQALRSLPILLIGTALSGASASLGYRGSLEVINEIAPGGQRAEVVSSYLIACFTGNSLPVVGIGVMSQLTSPLIANAAFAVVISVLAVLALLVGMRSAPKR